MTPRERAEWMEAILADPSLTTGTKCVAIRMALHLNLETGRCDPSIPRLATGAATTTRSVERSLLQLTGAGWIRRAGRQGTSNQYHFVNVRPASSSDEEAAGGIEPPTPTSGVEPLTPDTHVGGTPSVPPTPMSGVHAPTPDTSVAPPPTPTSGDPRHLCRGNKELNKEENRKERESLPTLSPADQDPARKTGSVKAEPSSASDEAFEEFWRQYPRRAGKKGARSVYDRIVGKGEATAAELLAGAMRYAAHRTGQDERYTKHPSTWLHQGCWLDEAPRPAWQPGDSAPSGEDLQRQFASDRNRAEYGIRPQQMSNVEIALAGLRRKDQ